MMKILKNILILIFFTASVMSCVKNDILDEMAEIGEKAPSLYLDPVSPIAFPNAEIPLKVSYWSEDDQFTYMSLNHNITEKNTLKIALADISYTYEGTFDTLMVEDEVYQTFQHNFVNWKPEEHAYALEMSYLVNPSYAKRTKSQGNTAIDVFVQGLYEEISDNFFLNLSTKLGKADLEMILVITHGVMDQATFDSYYDVDGNKLETAAEAFNGALRVIGMELLTGTTYSRVIQHNISLQFVIKNGTQTEGRSLYRAFNIN